MRTLPDPILWIAQTSLRGSLIIALLICARPFLRRWVGNRVMAGLWLIPAACLLMPCASGWCWNLPAAWSRPLKASFWSAPLKPTVRVSIGPVDGSDLAAPFALATRSTRLPFSQSDDRVFSDSNVWNVLWLAGFGLAVANLGAGWMRSRRWAAQTMSVESGSRLARVFASIPASCRRGVSLRLTEALEVPAAAGVWCPQIWLPHGWAEELEEVELRHVLLHELGHVRRYDLLAQWVCSLACCVHWFNPLAWILVSRARADRELACDAWVLDRARTEGWEDFPAAYGHTLIKIVARLRVPAAWKPPFPVVPMAVSKQNLSLRVREISTFRPLPPWRGISVSMLAVVATVALVTSKAATPLEEGGHTPDPAPTPASMAGHLPSPGIQADSSAPPRHSSMPDAVPPERRASIPADRLGLEYRTKTVALSMAAIRKLQIQGSPSPAQAELLDQLAASVVEQPADTDAKPARFAISCFLSDRDFQEIIRRFNECEGVDLLSAPRVTAKPQQKATVEIVREFQYAKKFSRHNDPAGKPMLTPTEFDKRNLGISLTVSGDLSPARDAVDLDVSWQEVALQGFVRTSDGKAVATADYKNDDERPVFSTRTLDTVVTMPPGSTLVLGGSRRQPGFWAGTPISETLKVETVVLTLVTVDVVELPPPSVTGTAGEAVVSPMPSPGVEGIQAGTSGVAADGKGYPYGVPVPGKPGFVTSPYAPDAGYVDVHGFARDADVRDPYTGKRFLVP